MTRQPPLHAATSRCSAASRSARNKAASSASRNPNDLINADGYDLLDSRVIAELVRRSISCRGRSTSRRTWPTTRASRCAAIYTVTPTIVPGPAPDDARTSCSCRRGDVPQAEPDAAGHPRRTAFRAPAALPLEPLLEVYNLLNENASLHGGRDRSAPRSAASRATSTAGWCGSASRSASDAARIAVTHTSHSDDDAA